MTDMFCQWTSSVNGIVTAADDDVKETKRGNNDHYRVNSCPNLHRTESDPCTGDKVIWITCTLKNWGRPTSETIARSLLAVHTPAYTALSLLSNVGQSRDPELERHKVDVGLNEKKWNIIELRWDACEWVTFEHWRLLLSSRSVC